MPAHQRAPIDRGAFQFLIRSLVKRSRQSSPGIIQIRGESQTGSGQCGIADESSTAHRQAL
jgi:hypothetical protein